MNNSILRMFEQSVVHGNKSSRLFLYIVLLIGLNTSANCFAQVGPKIGERAQNFIQNDTLGNPIEFSDYSGKYILLEFWASWCGPCRMESANLVKNYKEFHPKGLEIIAVSLDKNAEDWKKAIQDDKLTWIHVSDLKFWKNEVASLYDVGMVPLNILINPDGIIIAKYLKGEKLHKELNKIFGEPKN